MKLVDCNGNEVSGPKVPEVSGVKAVGAQVVVEMLTPQEVLGTALMVGENTSAGAPQAYIVELGPKVDPEFGIKAGDRVVLSGNYTPLPEAASASGRKVGAVEPHNIKAVLKEGSDCCEKTGCCSVTEEFQQKEDE